MTLVTPGNRTVLVECPACGYEWDANCKDGDARWKHIAEHSPVDFGLSPLQGQLVTDGGEEIGEWHSCQQCGARYRNEDTAEICCVTLGGARQ